MTNKQLMQNWIYPLVIVSIAFFTAFVFTFVYIWPAQQAVMIDANYFAILIFLPHGVRVIAAWLYGWRSFVFLTPASFAGHLYLWGADSINVDFAAATFVGVWCAAFSFWALAKVGLDFRLVNGKVAHWKDVVITGTVASVLNSVMSLWFYDKMDWMTVSTRFAGDIMGMLVLMAALAAVLWLLKPRT